MKHACAILTVLFALSSAFGQTKPTQTPATSMSPADLFKSGIARHDAGDFRGAIDAFQKALSGGMNTPQLKYRLARAYSRAGDREKALAALQDAVDSGFGRSDLLFAENDFLPIRSDARWSAIVAGVQKNLHPCRNGAEFRQFDYWLGEWDVEVGGVKAARSSVQAILDDCVIFENYALRDAAYAGKSFSLWDATTQKWEQRYVDTSGALHHWSGQLEGDHLVFYWRHKQGSGEVLDRMTYFRESPDKVRQLIESSSDEGKSWTTTFDGMYVRRK